MGNIDNQLEDFSPSKISYYIFLSILFTCVSCLTGWILTIYLIPATLITWYLVIGAACGLGGLSLILEHYLMWGYLEFEWPGHETYGAILISIGCILAFPYFVRKAQTRCLKCGASLYVYRGKSYCTNRMCNWSADKKRKGRKCEEE